MQDTNRLALLAGCHLVFYWMARTSPGSEDHRVHLLRDFRRDFDLPRVRYFVVGADFFRELPSSWDHLLAKSTYFFARPFSAVSDASFARGLAQACGLPQTHLRFENFAQLLAASSALWELWRQSVLVLGYKGSRGSWPGRRTTLKNFQRPSKALFEVQCTVVPEARRFSMAQLAVENFDHVVCHFGGDTWCKLRGPYAAEVERQCRTKVNEDVLRDPVATLEVGRGGSNFFASSASEVAAAKARKRKKRRGNACDRIPRYCSCHSCRDDVAYLDNMNLSGPEKLLTRNLGPGELLKMLGQDSWHHLNLLEELSRLSVAAFDIESTTLALHHQKPAKNLPQADLDVTLQGQHSLALQKPIMLAHRDGLLDASAPCPVFTLAGDEESDVYQLVREYWAHVRQRQKECAAQKRLLAEPLLDLLTEYEMAYIELAKNWTDPYFEGGGSRKLGVDDIASGFRHSLPGRLKQQLNALIERYEVFSFYGSGYDQVLLTSYLIPYLFERRLKPSIEKTGNKVNVLKVKKCHVTFRDVVKLLSPGTSLRQFGQLFNLDQAKAHFPFSILTGVESLQRETLPLDLGEWQSDLSLTKKPVTEEEVREAHRLFRVSCCKNVGDYLKTYLRLDVDILYKAVQGWRRTIVEEIGVDFVQTGKFTVSAVSTHAGDLCSSKNLQVGQFFPNSGAVYRLLRKGMRG